jgi:hypothetical protein
MYHVGAHTGTSRGVIHDLTLIYSVATTTLWFEFCLGLVFHLETDIFHCNCDTEFFCCESGLHSYSTPL